MVQRYEIYFISLHHLHFTFLPFYLFTFLPLSVLEVNSLHAVAYASQYLVRYSVEHVGQYRYRQVVAKYLHAIAFLAVYSRYVNHSYIHTDIAHVFSLLAIYQAVAMAIAEMTV